MTLTKNQNQYVLPFDAARNDLLAQIRLLRACDIQIGDAQTGAIVSLSPADSRALSSSSSGWRCWATI